MTSITNFDYLQLGSNNDNAIRVQKFGHHECYGIAAIASTYVEATKNYYVLILHDEKLKIIGLLSFAGEGTPAIPTEWKSATVIFDSRKLI